MKRNEDSLRDLWDNIKHNNIHIIGVPGEERDKLKKKLLSKKEPELEDLENSILCLPPIVFWKQITCCFHRFTAEEELCLRMNQTWNLSIFDLDETLNLEFMLE